jgi:lysophospholipase L1-like esterase
VRELAARLILVLVSTLIGLLVCEVVLRLYLGWHDPATADVEQRLENSRQASPDQAFGRGSLKGLVRPSSDPEVIYELKPRLQGRFLGQPFVINSLGLRGREVLPAKPPGTLRIAGLGDSVMFGWGVGQSETYLEILERRLHEELPGPRPAADRAEPRRYEALNFAVPGYNTAMEAAVFETKVLGFEPDLVILQVIHNDLELPPFLCEPRRVWSLDRSVLLDLVRDGRRTLVERHRSRLAYRDKLARIESAPALERYRHMEGEAGFRRAMARLAALAREHSLPVLVMTDGTSGDPWNLVHEVVKEHGFHALVTEPYYGAYLEQHGIERSPEGWAQTFFISRRDQHPNAVGHRVLAGALLDKIEEEKLLPSSSSQREP